MKLPPVFLVAAVVGFILFYGTWSYYGHLTSLFFAQALREANVGEEEVIIEKKEYKIADGTAYLEGQPVEQSQALVLAYEKTLAKHRPLLALPGVDLHELEEALNSLEQTQRNLATVQSNETNRMAVRDALYPTNFLRALTDTEYRRRAFIENGTPETLDAYQTAQQRTIGAYLHDLDVFELNFKRTVPENAREYADATSIISREGTLRALHALRTGMRRIETLLRSRTLCTKGLVWNCTLGELRLLEIIPPEESGTDTKVHPEALTILSAFKSARPNTTFSPFFIELSEPSLCATSPGVYTIANAHSPWSSAFERPIYIGDLRFLKNEEVSQTTFGTSLQKRGMQYLYDSSTTHYACFAWAEELSRVMILDDIYRFAKTTPVSQYATNAVTRAKLKNMETELTKNNTIKESEAIFYLAILADSAYLLPQKEAREAETLALQWGYRDTSFDSYVNGIAKVERINVCLFKSGIPVALEAPYLFFVRSGFVGFFMAHNGSVTDNPGTFFEPIPPDIQQPYIFYSQFSDTREGARMLHDLQKYKQLHDLGVEELDCL